MWRGRGEMDGWMGGWVDDWIGLDWIGLDEMGANGGIGVYEAGKGEG